MRKKGIFISIEGGEGTGKTTQTKLLKKYLKKRGYEVLLTLEPGGTRIGKYIRKVLLDPANKEIDKFCELFLYLADRAQHTEEVILPALKKGMAVISDRFLDATAAYQGFGRGINKNLITLLNRVATKGIKPDLTICLDIVPDRGLKRAKRKKIKDRLEEEGLVFHSKVRKGYLALAREEPSRIKVIKVVSPPYKTYLKIKKHLDILLKNRE